MATELWAHAWQVSDPQRAPPLTTDGAAQAWRQRAVIADGGFAEASDVYFGQHSHVRSGHAYAHACIFSA